jgi:hypothetical protein
MARAFLAGMIAVGALCFTAALVFGGWGAALFYEMDLFYRTSTGDHPDEVYLYYDVISRNSYVMQDSLTPLISGAVFAVLGVLTTVAVRWERREGRAL